MRHELDLVPVPELVQGNMARSRAEWIDLALQSAISLVPCDGAVAVARHREGFERWSRSGAHAAAGPPLEAGASPLVDWLGRHRQPLRVADLAADPRLFADAHPTVGAGPALFAPVADRRRSLGYIAAYRRSGAAPFTEEQVRVMALLASWTGMALETLRLSERVEKLAITDDLTQVYNYRFLKTALRREMKRAMRFGQELSLVMLDVDNLKAYNDRHGHLRGSFLLKRLARLLAEHVRSFDLIAKYGGDEFTLILPQTGQDGARIVAERMRAAVMAHGFPLAPPGSITISLGLATFPADARDGRELIRAADRALYRAKQSGRNRVATLEDAEDPDSPPAGEGRSR